MYSQGKIKPALAAAGQESASSSIGLWYCHLCLNFPRLVDQYFTDKGLPTRACLWHSSRRFWLQGWWPWWPTVRPWVRCGGWCWSALVLGFIAQFKKVKVEDHFTFNITCINKSRGSQDDCWKRVECLLEALQKTESGWITCTHRGA